MAVQAACAAFFVYDVSKDLIEGHGAAGPFYLMMESAASLSLLVALAIEWQVFQRFREERAATERLKQIAGGKVSQMMSAHFDRWGLTASERDVAELAIKGCGIDEIASLRECRAGTVKAHLNAIYRKSNTRGRAELVSLMVEDLMSAPLVDASLLTAIR